jgi:hypothetical protein
MHGCKGRSKTRTSGPMVTLKYNFAACTNTELEERKQWSSGATPLPKQVPTWLHRPRQRCPIANEAHGSKGGAGGRASGRGGRNLPSGCHSLSPDDSHLPPPSSSTTTTTSSVSITSCLAALTKEHHRC